MRWIDHLQIGPFAAAYHRALVGAEFEAALAAFLERELVPQWPEVPTEVGGSLVAACNGDQYCGPQSLVKDYYALSFWMEGDSGYSELKSHLHYDPLAKCFAPRPGHYFYLSTPERRRNAEAEKERIQQVVDRFRATHATGLRCPVCLGKLTGVDDPTQLVVRCVDNHCFEFAYHKNQRGHLTGGQFTVKHPARRVEVTGE